MSKKALPDKFRKVRLAVPEGIKISQRGLEIGTSLSFEEWEHLGKLLKTFQQSIMWWVGDWLNYGEKKYGETYAQAVEATGYEPQTLMDAKWVASRIEISRRREILSWSHHREVAALESPEQESWLDKAQTEQWSTRDLRQQIKAVRLPKPANSDTCEISDLFKLIESGKKFGTIYADPPWEYDNKATRSAANRVYDTMTPAEIAELPIRKFAAKEAHLHLWTTNAFLFDCKQIMEAWGFEYKGIFIWVKPQMGIGNYWRVSHELLLLGVRGGLTFTDKSLMSWLLDERGEHSSKPEKVRKLIEKASPAPRIELFARRCAEGWAAWGNEIRRDMFTQNVAIL